MADDHFGEAVAERYDTDREMFAAAVVDPTVDALADLAGNGAALELGIGTGRIALPLAARGVEVHGIDLSPAMLARLRAKPGADRIGISVGDFAETVVEGRFSLVYLVFNTIMNLTTQEDQVACFGNAARHLDVGGYFVVEVMIPELQRLPAGQTVRPFYGSAEQFSFDEYDLVTQGLVSHHYRFVDGRLAARSLPCRFVWPSELDLMARLAGMRLRERWGGWHKEPFTGESRQHVSVWQKVAATPDVDGVPG